MTFQPLMRSPLPVALLILLLVAPPAAAQEITGLEGWSIFLDPGHSRFENQGAFGYSEAEKNLRVGLELRALLRERTDIDSVWISRKTDNVTVSLSQRVDFANRVGAAHFHSIHSNAAGNASANFLFVLWPQYRNGEEAVPNGGKRMSELMAPTLSDGMRIPLFRGGDGAVGECDFYGVSSCRGRNLGTGKGGSRNFVQSFTTMPSGLSEAGFHTNPRQNQRNMNADWKRLEARAMFWSILDYHGVEQPDVQTLTGTVRDIETRQPLNGVTVTVADTSYTTDTYESLFSEYSNDPGRLHNGLYYLDDLPEQDSLTVTIEKEGYETEVRTVAMADSFFTFFDARLISNVPPRITETTPTPRDTLSILENLTFRFSRKMDTASVRKAFSIEPATGGTFRWSNNQFRLDFVPDTLRPLTDYSVRIDSTAKGIYNDRLDGNGDGTEGDAYTLSFQTGPEDARPPRITDASPAPGETSSTLRPVVSLVFNERLDKSSVVPERFQLTPSAGGSSVPGQVAYHAVEERGVVSFFPGDTLQADAYYRMRVTPGLRDRIGNEMGEKEYVFQAAGQALRTTNIDDFDEGAGAWFGGPAQSGSTIGIHPDSTGAAVDTNIVNHLTESSRSYRIDYGWDEEASSWLIRQYLQGGEPKRVEITADDLLQAYVFGDGSDNRLRFVIDEGGDGGFEASPWTTVDWIGWRLVTWDLSEEAVAWVNGNGSVEGDAQFDSFQLTHGSEAATFGQLHFDDLRTARKTNPVASEPAGALPTRYVLHAPYPNPVRERVTFRFDLPAQSRVELAVYNTLGRRVATLAGQKLFSAGTHTLTWRPDRLSSGVYLVRMQTGGQSRTVKLVLVE